ncbi:Bax protein [Kineobactrum sediminis]|uniref:Bax protein n=2 Tax=Kineobactrum sediminis TaxID=1905677 RepID=A0A2N5Y2C7_9GAMM|nr:Bax protein [Kineobactrum sediminis]
MIWAWNANRSPNFGELPDLAAIKETEVMKVTFFDYLAPVVEYHNDRIREQRQRLRLLHERFEAGDAPGFFEQRWLSALAQEYELHWDPEQSLQITRQLLMRVDTLPVPLVLVQAVKESGWGRSRFAVEGNNLFGQWCYVPGCGIIPRNRAPGKIHEVQTFDSVSEAVRRYMNNLNTHESYAQLRRIRADLRAEEEPLTGLALANGLLRYSERREAYVAEVKSLIRQYHRYAQEG